MSESILLTIKQMIGGCAEGTDYDLDLIVNINSVLSVLYQIGVTPTPVSITGGNETWSLITGTNVDIEMVKTYIYLRVKTIFDPDTNSALLEARKKIADEYECRLMDAVKYRASN